MHKEQNTTSRNAAECRVKQKPKQSFLQLHPNTTFTRQQVCQSLSARGQAAGLRLSLSHPCQVLDPQPTTRFSSGLSGLLSWKYSTAFWILSMQFKYSSSLPVGLKIKPKIQSSECPKKQRKKIPRKHQTKLRIKTRKISIPFSSTRRRSWYSLLLPLNAAAEYPIHTPSGGVLMTEQHTTLPCLPLPVRP